MSKPDLQFANHGPFITCEPETPEGQAWLDEHLGPPPVYSIVHIIEHRYLEDIVLGARADGLICEG